MSRLFGTDGVRGLANKELTPELAFKLGIGAGHILSKNSEQKPKVVIGTDTRISGDMLESALTAGLCSVGIDVYYVGDIPTPAIPYLTRKFKMDAGVMISASHNKVHDNGIKFFDRNGFKLADQTEDEIEKLVKKGTDKIKRPIGLEVGRRRTLENPSEVYIDFLLESIDNQDLSGLKVAIDCANGATSYVAYDALTKAGVEVFAINRTPDGTNINDNCGSTHLNAISKFVKENNFDIGFAFDGDGDRCLAVDSHGDIVDGDQLMAILGHRMKQRGLLKKDTIVATVMTNLGLKIFGEKYDINIVSANVGDRYVLENMLENDCNLGGEQSGHIIMMDYNTTGDGVLSALHVLAVMKNTNKSIEELNSRVNILPQVLLNAKVNNKVKHNFMDYKEISKAIDTLNAKFAGKGRVLIRPSGTEPLVRVMIEGEDPKELEEEAKKMVELIEQIMC